MDNKKTDQGQGKVQEAVKEVEQNSNGAGSGVTGKKFSIRNGQVVDDKGEIVGDLSEGKEVKEEEQQANGEQNEENGEKKKEGEENVNGENKVSDEVPESVEETIDETQAQIPDLSILKDKTVNKAGNIVDENGTVFGKLTEGQDNLKNLIGKSVDEEGKIWNAKGQVLARVEPVPENERQYPDHAPFEAFPDATVEKTGNVVFNGTIIGKVVEGDARKLAGKKVDADGEIVDNLGNVLGRADRWEEEEPEVEEEEKPDLSALAGKRVNKVGNVVDQSGALYGRLVEGDPKKLSGKMCDKDGNVWNDGGQVVGRAELVPDSEREGEKEGIFAGFEGLTVNKEGKIVDAKGAIVGRLSSGDAKQLYGKQVDEDGDILDKNGNVLGKAERWEEEEEPEKEANPLAGLKINREGNVVDSNGEIIGKLTEGTLTKCVGQEIDNDGDIVNSKGHSIGHATLLSNIPPEPEPEEPGETEEEAEKRKQAESDKKLAGQMAGCIEQSIDKIKPVLKMITEAIEAAERQPKEELDEQKLVDTVKPLLEEGGQILQEANGVIRGLDPDGRIAANAKHKTAAREASPEEYRLADLLKELAGNVSETIDGAKKKIAGMPHAKKELNPLWGLLAEPLGQILAAVGLLLSGVLGLVGKLLSGLGLGGLVDNLLGGLGLKGILEGLGLGMIPEALTGKKS